MGAIKWGLAVFRYGVLSLSMCLCVLAICFFLFAISMVLDPDNSLVTPLVTGSSTTYSHVAAESITEVHVLLAY